MAQGGEANKLIAIYNLDENNSEILSKLTACLTQECSVKYYKEMESYDNLSIGDAISTLRNIKRNETNLQPYTIEDKDLEFLKNKDLTTLLYDEYDEHMNTKSYDVVMILGHSNIYHIGPFDTANVLEVILKRHDPSIIALLGCCGGGTRFGSLLEISQMGSKTIFGFYQRRIYPDELVRTSLVLGIRYYLHLKNFFHSSGTSEQCPVERIIIRRSFVCAALEIPLDRDDPSIFANDSDQSSPVQDLLKVFQEKFSSNPIPLACLQLALFHVFTVEERTTYQPYSISTFTEKIKQLDVCKIEKESESELLRRQLDEIISLTAEILLLPVLDDTLDKLKDGRWEEVDPLQFMIAMLHGYWGRNSYRTMRCCAQYHHERLRQDAMQTKSEDDIHRYQLGAIALCLFCESTYVKFNFDNELAFQVGLSDPSLHKTLTKHAKDGIKFDLVNPITIRVRFSSDEYAGILEKGELIWADEHYEHMHKQKNYKFIRLLTEGNSILLHDHLKPNDTFNYTAEQFKNALNALQTSLIPLLQGATDDIIETEHPYYVKKFDNECSESKGRMKCFKPWPSDYGHIKFKYAEMRISSNNSPLISRCRFVYQYCYNRKAKKGSCIGTLYFTDSHYGWDLIEEGNIDKTLRERNKHKVEDGELKKLSYSEKQKKLSKMEMYKLQDQIKGKFPFQPIANLKIEYKLKFNNITKCVDCANQLQITAM